MIPFMKRSREPFSFPITFDLVGLVTVLTLIYFSPIDLRARFGKELTALMTGHRPECAYQQSGPNLEPATIAHIAGFSDTVRNGARGIQSLISIPAHGYQPFREYERHIDHVFEDIYSPQETTSGITDFISQGIGTSGS